MSYPTNPQLATYIIDQQTSIVAKLQKLEQTPFKFDSWQNNLGNGICAICEGGETLERAAVNISFIQGNDLPAAALPNHNSDNQLSGKYTAMGLSLICHPRNPYAPIVHLNIRYFATEHDLWWFGGGMDLTPIYPFNEDCEHFHRHCQLALASLPGAYQQYKQRCDQYFFIPHRGHMRGIGGIFIERLNQPDYQSSKQVICQIAEHFPDAYIPLLAKRSTTAYQERELRFLQERRAHYAEFNLLYDRGTKFGLQSKGRIQSIFASMPPSTGWSYFNDWEANSDEAKSFDYLQPCDWLTK